MRSPGMEKTTRCAPCPRETTFASFRFPLAKKAMRPAARPKFPRIHPQEKSLPRRREGKKRFNRQKGCQFYPRIVPSATSRLCPEYSRGIERVRGKSCFGWDWMYRRPAFIHESGKVWSIESHLKYAILSPPNFHFQGFEIGRA